MDFNQLDEILKTRCKVERSRCIVVGFSGGADSTALLLILKELGYPLIAAHFNHRLRVSSQVDAQIAEQIAARVGVRFQLGEADVESYARQYGYSLEEAARKARYQFLFTCAREANAQAVAVGHHANDQIETVLMNFLRGAGLDGLTGMAYRCIVDEWDRQIPVVRPLLSTWREEIASYCAGLKIEVAEDPTNQEAVYARNRVRLQLLPILEQYNPSIREAIWRTADILQADAQDLLTADEPMWQEICEYQSQGLVQLNHAALKNLTKGGLRRQLRRAIEWIRPGLKDFDFSSLERAANFVRRPTRSRKMDLAGGLEMRLENEAILIRAYESNLPQAGLSMPDGQDELLLTAPGEIILKGGFRLCCSWVEPAEVNTSAANDMQVWFDADDLVLPLVVRARKPGDRFRPFGLGGQSQKVSDLMVNEKIAARLRGRWPLICSQNDILWVPGARRSNLCVVAAQSTRILRIWLEGEQDYSDSSSFSG